MHFVTYLILFFLFGIPYSCGCDIRQHEIVSHHNDKESYWQDCLRRIDSATSMRISWADWDKNGEWAPRNDFTIDGEMLIHIKKLLIRHTVFNRDSYGFNIEIDSQNPYFDDEDRDDYPELIYPILTFYDKEGKLLLSIDWIRFYPSVEDTPNWFSLPPDIFEELNNIIMSKRPVIHKDYRQ